MRPILASPIFLLGSAIVLLFANGCGQGEGGRCQIDSDCASGLTCDKGETGNGTCISGSGGGLSADAALKEDASLLPGLDLQSQAETQPVAEDAAEPGPEPDAGDLDGVTIDGQAMDSL